MRLVQVTQAAYHFLINAVTAVAHVHPVAKEAKILEVFLHVHHHTLHFYKFRFVFVLGPFP